MLKNCHFANSGSGYPGHKSSHISATERAIHFKGVKSVVFMKSSANSKKFSPIYARFLRTRSHICHPIQCSDIQ